MSIIMKTLIKDDREVVDYRKSFLEHLELNDEMLTLAFLIWLKRLRDSLRSRNLEYHHTRYERVNNLKYLLNTYFYLKQIFPFLYLVKDIFLRKSLVFH